MFVYLLSHSFISVPDTLSVSGGHEPVCCLAFAHPCFRKHALNNSDILIKSFFFLPNATTCCYELFVVSLLVVAIV